jgi:hypothetical protein
VKKTNVNAVAADPAKEVIQVELSKIDVGARIRLDFPNIEELAADIAEKGLTYPISVNRNYKLIDGERRLRAFRHLGRETVPAIVEDVADEDILDFEISLNVQRESFNPIEAAVAADRLIDKYQRPVGRPKKGEGSGDENEENEGGEKISPNWGRFSGNAKELTDWAAKKAGLGGHTTYERVQSIRQNGTKDVQDALEKKVISIHWAYQISRQKPDVQLSWLNKSVDDLNTDRKALAELNKKRRGEKSLIRAGIDPKKTDSPAEEGEFPGFGPNAEHLLIRIAPDFFTHKVATVAKFPIRNFKQPEALVCIEVPNRKLPEAFELIAAWKLHYQSTITVCAPTEKITFLPYITDEPTHIIVCGFVSEVCRSFRKVRLPSVITVDTYPRIEAFNVLHKYFMPKASGSALDASSEEPRDCWLNCKAMYNIMIK